jgi:hypothetical protein
MKIAPSTRIYLQAWGLLRVSKKELLAFPLACRVLFFIAKMSLVAHKRFEAKTKRSTVHAQ